MPKRLGRAEQASANRRRLLDAARRVFLDKGFHAASLDLVAAAAGLTKGAVYSRFRSKADLFLALLEERIDGRIAEMSDVAGAVRGQVALAAALSRQWDEKLRADAQWSLLLIEFRLHAARDVSLNRRYASLHGRLRRAMAAIIEREAEEAGESLAVPAEDIARAALALGTGAVLERCADGAAFPAHLMEVMNGAMILGLGAPEQPAVRRRARKAAS